MSSHHQKQTKARVLKDGKVHLYTGRKKATEKEIKAYLRANLDTIEKGALSKDLARKYGQIKGGVKRFESAKESRIKGRYVDTGYLRAAKRMGIDLDAMVKASGEKSLNDLFEKNKGLEESFKKLMSGVGLAMWHAPEKVIDIITDYKGREIIINGETYNKTKAKAIVRQVEQEVFREYEPVSQAIKVSFKGTDQMLLDLPEYAHYEGTSVEEFIEVYSNFYQIYVSTKKAAKGR